MAQRPSFTEQHIAEIDGRVVSPSERAEYIWAVLKSEHPDLTDWDVLCFAGEYLGMMTQTYLWLEEPAKRVLGLIYTAHYMNPETIDGESIIKRAAPSTTQHSDSGRNTEGERKGDESGIIKTRFTAG
jgi:hypothetical protein